MLLSLIALALGAAAGCRRSEPIRIGLVAGLTGRHYDLGVSCRNGAQLAVDDANAAGGVRGRPLELLVRDDAQDPETARRAVRELVGAGVVAIVGPCTSSMAEATLPIADREQVLMVAPTVAAPAFLGKDDWLVLADASGDSTARALAAFATGRWPGLRVAVLHDRSNRTFSEPWRETFGRALEAAGGHLGTQVPFTSGQVGRYGELAEAALTERPTAVLIVANALDTAVLAQQLERRAPGVQLLASAWSFTEDLPQHGGSAVEGILFAHKIDVASPRPEAVRFREAYTRSYGKPPFFAAVEAYDSVRIVAAGLERDPTRQGVRREVLRQGTFRGLTEDFTIDRFGDAHRPDHVSTVREGRFQLIQ